MQTIDYLICIYKMLYILVLVVSFNIKKKILLNYTTSPSHTSFLNLLSTKLIIYFLIHGQSLVIVL